MHQIRTSIATLGILVCLAGTAVAAPINGLGAGYHGGLKYTNNTMSGVGPYLTAPECTSALQAVLNHSTAPPPQGFGWTVSQVVPCHYRSAWSYEDGGFNDPSTHFHDYVVPVKSDSPASSAEYANAIIEEYTRLRREFRIDDFDRMRQSLEEAFGGR